MSTVLITAFEPYDIWQSNASWLALVALTRDLPESPEVTTRLYPVDYDQLKTRLADDLVHNYDVVLHLGQAPGSHGLRCEAIGVNVASRCDDEGRLVTWPLVDGGPVAYQTKLPLDRFCEAIRSEGVPASISYHAGIYLCNAAFYYTHHYIEQLGLDTRATFLHLPLDTTQVVEHGSALPSLPAERIAAGLRRLLDRVV